MKQIVITFTAMILISGIAFAKVGLLQKAQSFTSVAELQAMIPTVEKSKDPNKDLILGIIYHNLATAGQDQQLSKALKYTDDAFKKTKNPLAQAYYGSAITLEANVAYKKGDVATASAKLDQGSKIIDLAVQSSPNDIGIRMLRINNAISISEASPFNRYDVIRTDLAFMKTKLGSLPTDVKACYYYMSGKVAVKDKKIDDAIVFFEAAVKSAPTSVYAAQARKQLALFAE